MLNKIYFKKKKKTPCRPLKVLPLFSLNQVTEMVLYRREHGFILQDKHRWILLLEEAQDQRFTYTHPKPPPPFL